LLFSVLSDDIAASGVFLAGIASIVTALLGIRVTKKRAKTECDERIAEIREAFRAGIRYELRKR
jgi:hypothetical protein